MTGDITREWVLSYCNNLHLVRRRSMQDEPFHDGAALFDGDRYLVKWASLKAAARKDGWRGTSSQFADALRKAGMVAMGNTSVARRQCRPWVIVLDAEESERCVRCRSCVTRARA